LQYLSRIKILLQHLIGKNDAVCVNS
jgi:hypothetical protein